MSRGGEMMNSKMSLEQAEFLFNKLNIAVICSNGAPINTDIKNAWMDGHVDKPYKLTIKKTPSDCRLNKVSS